MSFPVASSSVASAPATSTQLPVSQTGGQEISQTLAPASACQSAPQSGVRRGPQSGPTPDNSPGATAGAAATSSALPASPWRNLALLAASQAALMTCISLMLATSALIGKSLATPALASLPLAVQYLGTLFALYPVARLLVRRNPATVFAGGALCGAVGFALAALGIASGSFALFALAGLAIGAFGAVGQYYRFVAADAVAPELRSTAISLTLSGGLIAALAGPALARWSRHLLAPEFAASLGLLAGLALLAALLARGLRLPAKAAQAQPSAAGTAAPQPLRALLAQRSDLRLAVLAAVIGYALMNLLMTATPLAMLCSRLDFAASSTVIQWHVVAMFLPSFFTGQLIRRWGAPTVMLAGCAATVASIGVALGGSTLADFEGALILLGIGWNFLYIGATGYLVERCPASHRASLQATNDMLVFASVALATFAAAPLVDRHGWAWLNTAALPVILWLALLLLRQIGRERRMGVAG
ncbi:MFS transporter [Dechloromonas sp. ZY10]|uniref:MFS transporter n=1 Tax=Dechloromonas aquae TaxID=2664436 RepID=UPI0035277C42